MKSHILALLVLGLATIAGPAQTNVLYTNLLYSVTISTNVPPADIERILSRLNQPREGFVGGSTRQIIILSDQRMNLLLRDQVFKGFTYNKSLEGVDHTMQNLVGRSMEFGFRDWLENNDLLNYLDSHVGSFVRDSIAPDEELMRPLSIYYEEPAQSWWERVGKKSFAWGVQPQASPYAFVSFKLSENKKTIFYTHLRLYALDNFSANQKVEAIVNVPIVSGWSITTGASYSTKERSTQSQCVGIIRAEYALTKGGDVRFSMAYQPGADRYAQAGLVIATR